MEKRSEPPSYQSNQNPTTFWMNLSLPWVRELGGGDTGRGGEAVTTSQVSQLWVYAVAGLVVVGALFRNGLLFGMGLLLGAALLTAWLWARFSLRGLQVERHLSQTRAFFGEEIEMAQRFVNNKPLPVPWMAVEDACPGALEVGSEAEWASTKSVRKLKTSVSLGWYERVTRRYTIRCTARGEHEFGPIQVQSGDVFGLFRRTEQVQTLQTLIVYPRYVPVEQLGITARKPFGDYKASHNLATDPLRLRTVREYAYGDNPRHIHWRASARRGTLQTKLFEPAATPQLFIFCNQETFTYAWQGLDLPTLELTITVAASLANYGLEQGYMVGLQVNSLAPASDVSVKINPSRDPGQFTRILESLARIRGWSGLRMEDLLSVERRNLSHGATVVVVTGIVSDDMLEALTSIRRAGYPVTLVETRGSRRAGSEQKASELALQAQGIHYYFVDAIGQAMTIEGLNF